MTTNAGPRDHAPFSAPSTAQRSQRSHRRPHHADLEGSDGLRSRRHGTGAKRFIGVFSANGTIAPSSSRTSRAARAVDGQHGAHHRAAGRARVQSARAQGRAYVLDRDGRAWQDDRSKPGGPHMKGPGGMLTGGPSWPVALGCRRASWLCRSSLGRSVDRHRIGTKTKFPSSNLASGRGRSPARYNFVPRCQPTNPPENIPFGCTRASLRTPTCRTAVAAAHSGS